MCQEHVDEVAPNREMQAWALVTGDVAPIDLMVSVPKGHGELVDVIENQAQRCQPLGYRQYVVASKREGKEIGGKSFLIDRERCLAEDA